MFQYLGGPGSTYGVGVTTIRRAVDTTRLKSTRAMMYNQLISQKTDNTTDGNRTTFNIQDFREKLDTKGKVWKKEDSLEYKLFNNKVDRMNTLLPFLFDNNTAPWELDKANTQDIIKFVFEAISNDDRSISTAIFFRAFLTSGITDNNSAQLNSFKYMGRGENFYTYQGFDRTIGFSFRIAAGSRSELEPLYNKLNTLMSQVYPDYSSKQGIMRAPVVRITIGDYLYRVPGFIENVNVTIDNNTPWEINLEKSQIGDIAELPHVVDVSVSFKPIMDILPRRVPIGEVDASVPTNAKGLVPKLIVNNPNSKLINEFTFKNPLISKYGWVKDEKIDQAEIDATIAELQAQEIIDEENRRRFTNDPELYL